MLWVFECVVASLVMGCVVSVAGACVSSSGLFCSPSSSFADIAMFSISFAHVWRRDAVPDCGMRPRIWQC
eukprot:12897929-Alexandrium_andersonii.AAC.1